MKKLMSILVGLIMLVATSCSYNLSEYDEPNIPLILEYKDEYEIAKHDNFASVDGFRKVDIYIEGIISKIDGMEVFIKDIDGYEWVFFQYDHIFNNYIDQSCVCYCRADGIYSSDQNIVIVSFEEKEDYRIEFEDGVIYSEFDNCTMHDNTSGVYAFGGRGKNNEREYHIIDLDTHEVQYLKYINGMWYYSKGTFNGIVFHKITVDYFDSFSEVLQIRNDGSLLYYINKGTGIISTSENPKYVQQMVDMLSGDSSFVLLTDDNIDSILFQDEDNTENLETDTAKQETQTFKVWVPTNGGTKYHINPSCSGMTNPEQVTLDYAKQNGFTACAKCN